MKMGRALVVPFPFNLHGMILCTVHLFPFNLNCHQRASFQALFYLTPLPKAADRLRELCSWVTFRNTIPTAISYETVVQNVGKYIDNLLCE